MRLIIAGSRCFEDFDYVSQRVDALPFKPTAIISGGARGVDQLGEWYAYQNNIPLEIYPAKWQKFGKSAGYIRNQEMANNAAALIAFWDGESKGTKHMINIALEKGLEVVVEYINGKY
jgi:hypothetical protein